MRVIVTGASGFVGGHLIPALLRRGHIVTSIDRSETNKFAAEGVAHYAADIQDSDALEDIFRKSRPDAIIHLAAQSNVPLSWSNPYDTCAVNACGTVAVIEAAHKAAPDARLIIVGSSDVYGLTAKCGKPLTEDMMPQPQNPYSITKLCAEQIAVALGKRYGMNIIVTRSFNHYGPGQSMGFVMSDFAEQIARIMSGKKPPVMQVGDLTAARDFTYVGDVVGAYIALMESDVAAGIYNVCSGVARRIDDVLAMMIRIADIDIKIEKDPEKMRPSDVPYFVGDAGKIKKATGWQPKIDIETGLEMTIKSFMTNLGLCEG